MSSNALWNVTGKGHVVAFCQSTCSTPLFCTALGLFFDRLCSLRPIVHLSSAYHESSDIRVQFCHHASPLRCRLVLCALRTSRHVDSNWHAAVCGGVSALSLAFENHQVSGHAYDIFYSRTLVQSRLSEISIPTYHTHVLLQRATELTLFTLPKGLVVFHALLARRGWVPANFPGASVLVFAFAMALMAATDRQVGLRMALFYQNRVQASA